MKAAFKDTGSLLLALLVLFSTVSFTVDKHFCGKLLVDSAVFSEAQDCGMHGDGLAMDEESCCKETKIHVEGQDELKHQYGELDFQTQVFVSSFAISYFDLFENLPENVIPFKDYFPPLLIRDIQLQDEVFLI